MVNEEKNMQEPEHLDVARLIGTLNRVQAPKDFDFHVKARIAKGRPVERRSSWLPVSVRYAMPLVLLLAVGSYFGFKTMYSTEEANVPAVAYAPSQPVIPVSDAVTSQPEAVREIPAGSTVAEVKTPDQGNKVVKTVQKTPVTTDVKTEKPGGGSVDLGQSNAASIRQPDEIDDNAPGPPKKVLVSASQFLASVGIAASSSGSGGRIQSVSGSAASAGIQVGDVIESVNVQTGTVRVRRDGKTITAVLR
ncbi:MAG TPA: hypothetical protein PLP21_02345 [Pyrinomonadaceae bacterium]|nr:hypothetical protein [Acidobacteriota bacterium]HQZ95125.1 hypothetical protein [Pyrinomonadaceae bacterium]